MKNHQLRPTGSIPFLEANGIAFPEANATSSHRQRHGRVRGHGYSHERDHGDGWDYHPYRGGHKQNPSNFPKKDTPHMKCNNIEANQAKGKNKLPPDSRDICYRCGVKGHWLRTCRTPKHLVELYQASIKTKGKEK
uniref:CCHC-type domain-containing protein n=1 Tax=Davidia involucrata TaxID=16924 RepID=A0A5B6YVL2_DAVIN